MEKSQDDIPSTVTGLQVGGGNTSTNNSRGGGSSNNSRRKASNPPTNTSGYNRAIQVGTSLRGEGYGGGGIIMNPYEHQYNQVPNANEQQHPFYDNQHPLHRNPAQEQYSQERGRNSLDDASSSTGSHSAGGGYTDGIPTGLHQRHAVTSSRGSHSENHKSSPMDNIQSHNYEPDESEVWRAYVAQTHFANRGHWWTTGKKRALKRWTLTCFIGVIQAFLATGCNFSSKALSKKKFDHVYELLALQSQQQQQQYSSAGQNEFNDYSYLQQQQEDDLFQSQSDINDNSNAYTDDDATTGMGDGSLNNSPSFFFSSPFLTFLFYQTLYAFIASIFVWIEPVSAGSGIPEIKCFLNGIDLPRVVRVKTLLCKVAGVTFSVAAGLPVGKEGPMVHSGAVVAAGISQGKTKFWGVDTSFSKFSDFRNDREKRDFVACGAAAGVCSAFGAPIGGVLFSLEEGASYWSTKLTWRAFFCAMSTLSVLFAIKNVDIMWGQANIEKLFSFGEFITINGEESNFSIWELSLFIIIGCLGGLIGAVFNATNEHLTIWRMKHVNHSKLRRIIEVVLVSLLMSVVSYLMPVLWNRCTPLPTDMQDWSNQEKNLVEALVPFKCKPGKEYNEVASLIFTDADTAIKQLFHFREAGAAYYVTSSTASDGSTGSNIIQSNNASTFSSGALFLFFIPYISMATIVYGIAVPSGLFVPSLLSGAAFGRLCGHLLHKLDHTSGTFADSGTYALMGAAAVLGGMARMTISLTVILLEATGDMQYVLPLMLTLMAARFTGNVFNEGLYDIHIKLKNIPFLEAEVPTIAERNEIVAGQVMSTEVKCLRPVERAGVVYDVLESYSHGTFPIVDTESGGTLYGTASRAMLCTLLQRRAFGSPEVFNYDSNTNINNNGSGENPNYQADLLDNEYQVNVNDTNSNNNGIGAGISEFTTGSNNDGTQNNNSVLGPKRLSPLVQWDTIERAYPKYPTINDVDMRDGDRNCWLDLRPYANTAPYTVNETASIQRTYRLFRTLGLRFLCVVNHNNQLVGIITRKDLLQDSLTTSLLRGRNAHDQGLS